MTRSSSGQALVEKLAENAHDLWAVRRMSEGWTLGKERDDSLKTHPDLIRHRDLPDSEQQYDRDAMMETIKAIVALGFRIVPPVAMPPRPLRRA